MAYKLKNKSRRSGARRKVTFKGLMARAKATLKKPVPKKSPAHSRRTPKKALSRRKVGAKKVTRKVKARPKKTPLRKASTTHKKSPVRSRRTPKKAVSRRKVGAKKVTRKVKARPKKTPLRKARAAHKKSPVRSRRTPKKALSRRKVGVKKVTRKVKARPKKSPLRKVRAAHKKAPVRSKRIPKKIVSRRKVGIKKVARKAKAKPPKAAVLFKSKAKQMAHKPGAGQKKASLKSPKTPVKTIPRPEAAAQKNTMDNYQIVRIIAQGGMGKIFKAIDIRSKKVVIMKQLIIADKEVLVKRFKREADIMLSLNHKNIVSVYDYLKKGSSYFIIMEFVDGVALEDFIKKKGMIEPLPALLIFNEVCKGLKYAHDRKIIHRDIKPNNVLVAKTGDVKLMDFGIAKSLQENDEGLTKTDIVMGTPAYMSPEQLISTKYVDSLTDIYSMGVMFYQMITGKKPYSADFTAENLHKISIGDYVHPKQLNPKLPEYCLYIVKKAMHHKKEKRFKDLQELIDHMSRHLSQFKTQRQINSAIKRALGNL